jgi:hypothetical protein
MSAGKARRATPQREQILKLSAISLASALGLFLIGYLFASHVLFPPLPEPKNGIVVPKLIGLTVPQAEAQLIRLGLRVSDVVELAHPTQPPGLIVAQSPLAGQQLRTAGAVRLGVSAGMPVMPVPAAPAPDTSLRDTVPPPDTLPPDTAAKDTLAVSATRGTK